MSNTKKIMKKQRKELPKYKCPNKTNCLLWGTF